MVRSGANSVGPRVGFKWDLGKLSYCVKPPIEMGSPEFLESDLRRTKVTPWHSGDAWSLGANLTDLPCSTVDNRTTVHSLFEGSFIPATGD